MNKKNKIDDMFLVDNGTGFYICRGWVILEKLILLLLDVSVLVGLFLGFDELGRYLAEKNFILEGVFNSDILYSVFLLPMLYTLKESGSDLFSSAFVKAQKTDDAITVKTGWLNKHYDKLFMKDVNNAEVYKSFGGSVFGYYTLVLYALGGNVSIPYIKENEHNTILIKNIMSKIKENQAVNRLPNTKCSEDKNVINNAD